ncbi:3-deoxy-D-manno-octulosonic acid transferase [Hanstruepera neustonica]|uniref:3-deoxy-D-manno-octulosonic acid transferase n=1 Tax=Hanstruepera neustonica TaxID=1445657 RepID=UPI001FAFDA30|nr:glycosyltransferase N-terminal domain-containing protein [Hanstruepera neustonica]
MGILYNIGILLAQLGLQVIALFNHKIKLGVNGRSETFRILKKSIQETDKCLWFHCASLGEFEQGLPVFQEVRKQYPDHKIVLTFFSPSGYEVRKNTTVADVVCYLPIDTSFNANRFLKLVNPDLTIFVKYDIWPNYLKELKKRGLKAVLISALFRENQSYFKFYGGFMRNKLFTFEHIFTQDLNSKELLEQIGYHNTTVSGDTRFDRVHSQLSQDNELDFIKTFKNDSLCLVAGSTWPEDENVLIDYINNAPENLKFIIAPHNIKSGQIQKLKQHLSKKTVLYSEKKGQNLSEYSVLIIDTIGLLSKIYSYADIAYVGGAIGSTGLHNTLEPAVFGIPIIIGTHYNKFPEAKNMIEIGGMFPVKDADSFKLIMNKLANNEAFRENSGRKNFNFIEKNTGAVIQIMNHIRI